MRALLSIMIIYPISHAMTAAMIFVLRIVSRPSVKLAQVAL